LVEIFKELSKTPPDAAIPQQAQPLRLEETPLSEQTIIHTIKLGDRKHIELFLSNAWAYGIILFAILALAGAFAMGRRFAPPVEQVQQVDVPQEFMTEAARIADTRANTPASASGQAPARLYDPATVTVGRGTGSGTGFAGSAPQGQAPGPVRTAAAGQSQPAQPLPIRALTPAPATGGDMYAVCILTYSNKGGSDKDRAAAVVKFLQDQGLPYARALTKKSGTQLVVTVGSFPTRNTPEARQLISRVVKLKYPNTDFSTAYEISIGAYQ
jgi:hypothetical protein